MAGYKQISLLGPEQQGNFRELQNAARGSFGSAANYYQNNLSDNPADFNAFAAPEMRQYNEQIIPDLAEQFAGMGAGNLSSSGFQNAAVSAGTDLSERLGALRAQIRQNSAQGLQNIGQQSLQHQYENIYEQPKQGFMSSIAPVLGGAAATALAGPAAGALTSGALNWISNKGQKQPYGNQQYNAGGGNSMGGQTLSNLRF